MPYNLIAAATACIWKLQDLGLQVGGRPPLKDGYPCRLAIATGQETAVTVALMGTAPAAAMTGLLRATARPGG